MPVFDTTDFSSEILFGLQKNLVAANLTNTNFYGNVVRAKTVKVLNGTDVSVQDYTPGTDLSVDSPGNADTSMTIDQYKAFAFQVDDTDEMFSNPDILSEHVNRALYQLEDEADATILDTVATGGSLTVDAQGLTSGDEAAEFAEAVRQARVALSKQGNAPRNRGRVLVVDADRGKLLEEYVTETLESEESAREGFIGRFAGFDIYESENVPTDSGGGTREMVFGHQLATTFANDMEDVEIVRPDLQFENIAKGLHIYGVKVFRPDLAGSITVDLL